MGIECASYLYMHSHEFICEISELFVRWGAKLKIGRVDMPSCMLSCSLFGSLNKFGLLLWSTNADMRLLQETVLNNDINDIEIEIPHYVTYHQDRNSDRWKINDGDLCAYIGERFSEEHLWHLNVCSQNLEMQWSHRSRISDLLSHIYDKVKS